MWRVDRREARHLTIRPVRDKRRGFALLVVIWGIGIISLLNLSFMSSGKLRLQMAFNIAIATRAQLIADGAINAAILSLMANREASAAQTNPSFYDGTPRYCTLGGAVVALSVEDEGGKVDINSASPKLLQTMLMGFGLEMRRADAVANAIVAFRTQPENDLASLKQTGDGSSRPFPPKRAPFQTIYELDQVEGIDAPLFHALAPFITVHSQSPGVDARAAAPALFAAIVGLPAEEVQELRGGPFPNAFDRSDGRFPQSFNKRSDHGSFLIRAETALPGGETAGREVIFDLAASSLGPYAIREFRRATIIRADELRSYLSSMNNLPEC
jgi:general secretion pathway protein K